MRLETTLFLASLGILIAVWALRGFGILTFVPGLVIWLLMFTTIGSGIVDIVQRTRRW
ncbi:MULTISPECIES: hypothetical protein [unclassified Leptolyngbya]|uniref:hypothetical protein n=1 Tax=unclassified Leptolyngbya TaxID=2650499 RepID=UPI00168995FC|nr:MULTISPECIES: hypothetical protein [unclassified Leptolyngbya]MBD1912892.1 hypothetical protein [Leptolyngbya sp. FACHB-8]MBD2154779.1 hypothetical protein [Leptolyngbya sp. FACHB-16]